MIKNNLCFQFVLEDWSTWPPSNLSNDQELAKLQDILLELVPKHLKRRLSPLAKTVFCALNQCGDLGNNLPVVFSSTHGELARSLDMIKLIEAGEEVSPTSFSLSVHNAIAGLYSIVYSNISEVTVLASGEDGIASGFLEALGMLQEGAHEVLLVFYDEPLPEFYPAAPFKLSTDNACAVVLKISQQGHGITMRFMRDNQSGYVGEQPLQLPLLIQFLSGSAKELQINTPRQSWHWQKLD